MSKTGDETMNTKPIAPRRAWGLLLAAATSVALAISCDSFTVGLGPKVDMEGPVLQMTGPDYMANVLENFTVSGTVRDDGKIASVTVTIKGVDGEWRHDASGWRHRDSATAPWTAVAGATWQPDAEGNIAWTLPVTIPGIGSGEYVIRVVAADSYGNSDSNSAEERTVVCDNTAPTVTVAGPILTHLVDGYAVANAEFSTYTLRDAAVLDKLYNGIVTIKGYQMENTSLDRLEIEVAGSTNSEIFWSTTIPNTQPLRNFSVDIPAGGLQDPDTHLPLTGRHTLQVITRSYDAAGNMESKANGWFCYWPEADTPWIVSPMDPVDPADYVIYPGYAVQGQAFDDDGIASLTIRLYEGTGGGATLISTTPIVFAEGERPRFYSWTVDPPTESGTYTVRLVARDANGVDSVEHVGTFTVEDTSLPVITVTGPDSSAPLFGDATGSFAVAGTVDDDSGVVGLRLVWINPQSPDAAANQISFLDTDSAGWSTLGTDADGNKVWDVSLGTEIINGSGRRERTFSQALNVFTDLGVGPTAPLGTYVFILRAVDANGRARTYKHVTRGDVTPPTLTVEQVTVRHSDMTQQSYTITSSLLLPNFSAGDEVRISGHWADISTDVWSNKSLIGAIETSWGLTTLTVIQNADGTWTTAWTTPPGGAVAQISATLRDYGGNQTTQNASFFVETDAPQLLQVSSSNEDGYYNAGDVIAIFLGFNKKVTFSGGTSPTLLLSNGRTATYTGGNNTATHSFSYTVQAGDAAADLDVSAIQQNGNVWRDTALKVAVMTMPTGVNSLAGGKALVIDTATPTLQSLSSGTPSGAYNAGKQVYVTVTFSEAVTVSGSPTLTLSTGVTVTNPTKTAANALQFAYTIGSGESAATLAVTSFNLNGATIRDRAENAFVNGLPGGSGAIGKTIVVDTTAPAALTINGITAGTKYATQSFTLTGIEAGTSVQYSTSVGSPTWGAYSGAVNLSINGDYEIRARQTDAAGNVSPLSGPIAVTLDVGTVLTSVNSAKADGIYPAGEDVDIVLTFRKPLWVMSGAPRLTLNTTPVRYATYVSGSGTAQWVLRYDGQAGDTVTKLNTTAFSLNGADVRDAAAGGTAVTEAMIGYSALATSATFGAQKNIKIISGVPAITGVSLTGTTLTISFDRPIYKGTGSVTLTQDATNYRVPAVMSTAAYDKVYLRADAAQRATLSARYSWTTNGASSTGTPDLDGKFVLNYEYNGNDADLIAIFRDPDVAYHVVTVPVVSSAAKIVGQTLQITLADSYALPVLGADYAVAIPAGIAIDEISQASVAFSYTVTPAGVEKPVIRVDKKSEKLEAGWVDGVATVVATQPLSTGMKIDCATPGATIQYAMNTATRDYVTILAGNPLKPKPTALGNPTMPLAASITNGHTQGNEIMLGDATNADRGYKYAIAARASDGVVYSQIAYETAFRSVLLFYNDGNIIGTNQNYDASRVEMVYVRGGDAVSGSTITPDFPLSWDHGDFTGARMMTSGGVDAIDLTRRTEGNANYLRDPSAMADNNYFYWVTWEINTTAYVGLLVGSVPNLDAGAVPADAANGPTRWGWMKNGYVPFKEYFPVFPGESRRLVSTQGDNWEKYDGNEHGNVMFARTDDPGLWERSGTTVTPYP
jgi:hypothetical protein